MIEIGQPPQTIEEIQGQFMGLMKILPEGWVEIERVLQGLSDTERDTIDTTHTLSRIVKENKISIVAVPYTNDWGEVDLESDLTLYSNHAKDHSQKENDGEG